MPDITTCKVKLILITSTLWWPLTTVACRSPRQGVAGAAAWQGQPDAHGIPSAKAKSREEFMVDMVLMTPTDQLRCIGKRHLSLKFGICSIYLGERGVEATSCRVIPEMDRPEVTKGLISRF